MQTQTFAPSLRTLLCPNCGAPSDVRAEGGAIKCSYCGVTNEIVPRPKLCSVEEAARTQRPRALAAAFSLAARDTGTLRPHMPPLEWPPELGAELVRKHPAQKIAIARDAWLGCYRSLAQSYSSELDARLYVLTMGLQSVALQLNELRCVRGALESALEATRIAAYRQVLFAQLALDASIAADVQAARTWLAQIDSRMLGIPEVETGVRLARACVALRAGNPNEVLALLGETDGAVPLAPYGDLVGRLLRVQALEDLDRRKEADEAYYQALATFGPRCVRPARRAYGLAASVARRGRIGGWTTTLVVATVGAIVAAIIAHFVAVSSIAATVIVSLITFSAIVGLFLSSAVVRRPVAPPIGYE
jgi:hypothetical protein